MQYKVFGCKVNKYYTDKWLNSSYLKNKSGVFIASCVVTDRAKRKWIKFIKDIFKKYQENSISKEKKLKIPKNWKVYISGCGAFKEGKAQEDFFDLYKDLLEYKEFIEVLGEDSDEKIGKGEEKKKIDLSSISKKINNSGIYTKKFVLIQGGCDSFCTFCLTVQKRGRHYFRSKQDIASEINDFEENGGKEVVLTGVNLSAWGLESTNDIGKSKFSELLEYLLKNTKIPRIRISSMGPEFIDKKCLKIFENKRISPHFHFSIQSGSSFILKKMRRHYDGDYIKKLLLDLRKIKRKDRVKIGIGADIIVGFPEESEKDFEDSLSLIKKCNITKIHAFPFSSHKFGESVPAGFYKNQISDKTKKERMNKIISVSENIRKNFIKDNKGKNLEVLVELVRKDGSWKGWSENYIEANNSNFEIISGKVGKNEIVSGNLFYKK